MNEQGLNPTDKAHRIESLDILRGFAVLGILIMNIQSFSMPGSAYLNPMAFGDMTGINEWVYILSHIFADNKFMTIFSILFGAGVVLFTDNALKKGKKAGSLHYRRTLWLIVIGLIHAHIIWYGDILFTYGICALILYGFRNKKPKSLIIGGGIVMSVHSLIYLFFGFTMSFWPDQAITDLMQSWKPDLDSLNGEIAAMTGTFSEQMTIRSQTALMMETSVLFMTYLWRSLGLMLIGMALYKKGVLSGSMDMGTYKKHFIISWLIGLPIVIFGLIQHYANDWSIYYSFFIGNQFNYWGSVFVSYGYICLIMMAVKSSAFTQIKQRLAAVGQMALTNYIMQSVLATLIFYGIGFGLFGTFERSEQALVVLVIWLIQLIWSKPWLSKFYFGPFEWLWRSLTYMKKQPLKKT